MERNNQSEKMEASHNPMNIAKINKSHGNIAMSQIAGMSMSNQMNHM